ncbi:MAG: thiamine-monophosphate kinase [Pseudohongiella sp.]|nr:MAG: thiamine-monophosphate kinase [Pseudohongiella sp.]
MPAREFELISQYFDQPGLGFPGPGVELGIGDDCALLSPNSGDNLALSMDTLVVDVHFPDDLDPYFVACRALAANLSDLAAMAATPLCFSLSLTLPAVCNNAAWLSRFAQGLGDYARRYQCPLVGGDTTSGPLSITIAVHGSVAKGSAWRRSGAQMGDLVYASGALGDAAIALKLLGRKSHLDPQLEFDHSIVDEEAREDILKAYFQPQPRLDIAATCGQWVNSAIDISDGLLADLGHICHRSGVGAEIELAALPYSEHVVELVPHKVREAAALAGGDDYELCLTVAAAKAAAFERAAAAAGFRVSCIGKITEGREIRCLNRVGEVVQGVGSGYRHC